MAEAVIAVAYELMKQLLQLPAAVDVIGVVPSPHSNAFDVILRDTGDQFLPKVAGYPLPRGSLVVTRRENVVEFVVGA